MTIDRIAAVGDMPRMIASMKVKGTVLDKTQTSRGARLYAQGC